MKNRELEPEEMDQDGLCPERHAQALAGLARLNQISFAPYSIWSALKLAGAFTTEASRPVRIVDVATGGGDLLVSLGLRARSEGLSLELIGLDKSPFALDSARAKANRHGISAQWICLDVTRDTIPSADWIVSSLFMHHLSDAEGLSLLRTMAEATTYGIIINDLERSSLNQMLVWLGAHLVSRSSIVHRDSDRSVCASFTLNEASALAKLAGLEGIQFRRRFPCRFNWIWTKNSR